MNAKIAPDLALGSTGQDISVDLEQQISIADPVSETLFLNTFTDEPMNLHVYLYICIECSNRLQKGEKQRESLQIELLIDISVYIILGRK